MYMGKVFRGELLLDELAYVVSVYVVTVQSFLLILLGTGEDISEYIFLRLTAGNKLIDALPDGKQSVPPMDIHNIMGGWLETVGLGRLQLRSARSDISQKPCCMTSLKYSPIGLNTFAAVLSTTWSYFSLASSLYESET
ncbi:unnamed protein product [Spodoptera exigua]|nr:unnamed protein product [Spodoptera exigua]